MSMILHAYIKRQDLPTPPIFKIVADPLLLGATYLDRSDKARRGKQLLCRLTHLGYTVPMAPAGA
ncbi:MAG: hypothetical protein P0120_05445 [Nitrospira sp.]|nr:hypothetical protein [Nitrospira sp.]